MKKFVSLLLVVILTAFATGVSAYANYADGLSSDYIQNTTNAYDLRAYGVHTFSAYKAASTPTLDGILSTGEYPGLSDTATLGDGLWLTNSTGAVDYTESYGDDYRDFTVKSYLAYDGSYAYIAEEVSSATPISYSTTSGAISTINATVRYGLNQSAVLTEAASRLSNTYSYKESGDSFVVSGCSSGSRNYRRLEDGVNQEVILDESAYTDPASVTWNRATYKNNAAVGYEDTAGKYTYVFEYRIPLTDIAYSAFGSYDEAATAALISAEQFFGSYLFQVAVTRTGTETGRTQLFLSTGIPGNAAINSYLGNDAVESSTWTVELKDFFTTADGNKIAQNYVPSPVYHFNSSDASTVSIPAPSGFRPGLSSFGILEADSVFKMVNSAGAYKSGNYNKTYTFTVASAGMDNTSPVLNDRRAVPTAFRVRSGYTTKLTGSISKDLTTGSFDASALPSGLYTLVVSFSIQQWDGSRWVDTGIVRNFARNITIAGSTRAANAAAQTGDDGLFLLAMGILAVAACGSALLISKKRRFHIN